jgi:hypothetical protein
VGAICAVSTGLVTVFAENLGLESSVITLVSSCEKPPCSASFAWLPESDADIRRDDDVRCPWVAGR